MTNPNPGPGYRLATEADNGATVFDVSDDGDFWIPSDYYHGNGKLHFFTVADEMPWFPLGSSMPNCKFKYARVPLDKPAFVPGEWYAVGGEKQCYVGRNPINGRSIFSNTDGVIVGIDKINAITPCVDQTAIQNSPIGSIDTNPNGLHLRYEVRKINGEPTDPNAIYFVLRLDQGGRDKDHLAACHVAARAYCDSASQSDSPLIQQIGKDLSKLLDCNMPPDPPAFRLCSAMYRGEAWTFTVAGRNAIRSDGECVTLSQLSQIQWHDEEGK